MRILELQLSNFKGIRDLVLILQGNDAKIRGDNAVGKTTIMDSFIWLLTGKDHLGRADYQIKTLDAAGAAIPMIDHTVRALVEHEGSRIGLIRTYKEVWTKKAGTNTKTFTGHETEYFINSTPKSAKDYQAFIDRMVPPQLLKLLIMPGYFCEQIKWDERRRMLLDMCGDISDSEILSRPEFTGLAPHVGKFVSVADLKTQKAAEKTKINKALADIPVKIDTHSKYLAPPGLTAAGEQAEVERLAKAIGEKTAEHQALYSGEGIAKLKKEMVELGAVKSKAKADAEVKKDELKSAVRTRYNDADTKKSDIMLELTRTRSSLTSNEESLEKLQRDRKRALDEYRQINESEFFSDAACPVCGQDIPAEKIEAARAAFNLDKSTRLEENIKNGTAIKAQIETVEARISELKETKSRLHEDLRAVNEIMSSITEEMNSITVPVDFDDSLITAKQAEIDKFNATVADMEDGIQLAINFLTEKKSTHEQNLSAIKNAEAAAAEIEKLKAEEKKLSGEFEECERLISLCDDFTNAKVQLLDAKISGAFQIVTWKLTETQVNGGLKEICDALINGVPYSAANNAAQINSGLDIIEVFSRVYGVSLPIFIDNAESVTQLNPMNNGLNKPQIIQLIVSEAHKKLTLEVL